MAAGSELAVSLKSGTICIQHNLVQCDLLSAVEGGVGGEGCSNSLYTGPVTCWHSSIGVSCGCCDATLLGFAVCWVP